MRITFATGADTRLFWNVCALAWTFSEHNPGHRLRIADFGLNPEQAQFLSSIGLLSAAPQSLLGPNTPPLDMQDRTESV